MNHIFPFSCFLCVCFFFNINCEFLRISLTGKSDYFRPELVLAVLGALTHSTVQYKTCGQRELTVVILCIVFLLVCLLLEYLCVLAKGKCLLGNNRYFKVSCP